MSQSSALLHQPHGDCADVPLDAIQSVAAQSGQDSHDHRLARRVERALHETGYGPLRNLDIVVQARAVILEGRVPNYYLKQIAQEAALAVAGIHQVRNDLEVV